MSLYHNICTETNQIKMSLSIIVVFLISFVLFRFIFTEKKKDETMTENNLIDNLKNYNDDETTKNFFY